MKQIKNLTACMIALLLCACSTNAVNLTYDPSLKGTTALAAGKPVVAMGAVSDERKNDPNWLGAIRGGFGNPLKTLTTEKPVSEVVKTALNDSLSARGWLAKSKGRYRLDVTMVRFDCSQYVRREAHIQLNVSLLNTANNDVVFNKQYKADHVAGNIAALDVGVFGSVDDLKKVANDTLQDVIDQIVTDPDLLAKLH